VLSAGEILPPAVYGPTHPEYYALVRGERDWKNFDGKHRCSEHSATDCADDDRIQP